MADLTTVATNIAAAVTALGATRCGSDRRTNLEALAAGALKYQLRVDHLTEIQGTNSNQVYQAATVTVAMHHQLSSATNERAYTEAAMLVDQESLLSAAWWRAISGVFDVVEGPTLQSEAERVGNTISYSVAVSISITG